MLITGVPGSRGNQDIEAAHKLIKLLPLPGRLRKARRNSAHNGKNREEWPFHEDSKTKKYTATKAHWVTIVGCRVA
jgi:hypothetical protein